jgi:hypothetical protein
VRWQNALHQAGFTYDSGGYKRCGGEHSHL